MTNSEEGYLRLLEIMEEIMEGASAEEKLGTISTLLYYTCAGHDIDAESAFQYIAKVWNICDRAHNNDEEEDIPEFEQPADEDRVWN